MKISLIGYGKMGKEIESVAIARHHEIVSIIDVNNQGDFDSKEFLSCDAAIEFSKPDSALDNFRKCFDRNISLVSGTTGWYEHLDEIKKYCTENNKTFLYSSNFSIGVNILFALNKYLSRIMNRFPEYDISMKEIHHIHKLDAPSGTAITLVEDILKEVDRKDRWVKEKANASDEIAIKSVREGEVPGIHEVKYESEADMITIRHEAKNRKGFALGAVIAAEFIKGKKGFFTIDNLFNF